MSDEMVRKVARAIRRRRGLYGDPPPSALADARAAIEEINGGWQPIATAPKDDTVLVWGPTAGEISGIEGYSSMNLARWEGRGDYPEFDWVCEGGDYYTVWVRPTHWMPIPPPPAVEVG